uniref:Uncharacterized protein n=1 Tax=Heterorhabditis bacteriophora TaxID=37862 RepID=A0A1I7XU83_HETBA
MQLFYDRPSKMGKVIDLEERIADGGFISKKIFNAIPMTNIENPQRQGPLKDCIKLSLNFFDPTLADFLAHQ